jgi:hypothetical protein
MSFPPTGPGLIGILPLYLFVASGVPFLISFIWLVGFRYAAELESFSKKHPILCSHNLWRIIILGLLVSSFAVRFLKK